MPRSVRERRPSLSRTATAPARQDGAEGEAAFVASMQGLVGLTRLAAHELSQYGIRVYAVENSADTVVKKVFSLLDL